MMRINSGIVCVLAALAVGACSWGNGSGNGSPAPDASHPVCGDNICAASEANSCPQDCGNGGGGNQNAVCGNGQCETTKGESATSCPSDCSGGGGGSGSGGGNTQLNCSDPNTQIGCLLCTSLGMCTAPYDAVSCAACGGGGLGSGLGSGGSGCVGGLPNGTCDPGENNMNCPFDCP
ncbi:MAG: hypothetical protein JO257_14780 [Deltaproteobacteria bacterium]|nr:hypothetical protein [Deltaproteobacteria bacterium]